MSRGPDAGTALERALLADARRCGCEARMVAADWERWASATFSGARHLLTLEADAGPALERWLAELPEAEIALRGHLLADVAILSTSRADGLSRIALEALTLEA